MKVFIVTLALMTSLAQASDIQTRTLLNLWSNFEVLSFRLDKVDGVEMAHLTIEAEEFESRFEDTSFKRLDFFYPVEVLSHDDYAILNKARGHIEINPFNSRFARARKLAVKLFTIRTNRILEGETRGWHRCTLETNSQCQGGVYYSEGPEKKTIVEVILK